MKQLEVTDLGNTLLLEAGDQHIVINADAAEELADLIDEWLGGVAEVCFEPDDSWVTH